jgi:hypothetical protein
MCTMEKLEKLNGSRLVDSNLERDILLFPGLGLLRRIQLLRTPTLYHRTIFVSLESHHNFLLDQTETVRCRAHIVGIYWDSILTIRKKMWAEQLFFKLNSILK